jgi:hypothetical protein
MWLEWTDGRISFIPDYRYYVVDNAELVLAPATRLRARGPPTDEPRSALGRRRPRSSQKKPNRKSQTEAALAQPRAREETTIRRLTRTNPHGGSIARPAVPMAR